MMKTFVRDTLILIFISMAIGLSPTASAKESCSRDVMCVIAVPNGDHAVDIYVENRQTADITVTLDARMINMNTDVTLPVTATFAGMQRERLFTMVVDKPGEPSDYHWNYKWTWGSVHAEHDDSYLYSLPYEEGKAFRIDQGFNGRFSHSGDFQYAIDWNMPEGTPILAARTGVVTGMKDQFSEGGPHRRYENFANYVMIKHDDGTVAEYAHLKQGSSRVKVGQRVQVGEVIALSGNTGFTTGPHLHFFVYKAVDGGKRQSFPVRFRLRDDSPTMLVEGESYRAYGRR